MIFNYLYNYSIHFRMCLKEGRPIGRGVARTGMRGVPKVSNVSAGGMPSGIFHVML